MTPATLNPRLQEIVDDFNAMPGKERLQLLLEFSQELPPLPDRYAEDRSLLEPVPECQSPLFLAVEVEPDATVHLFFEAPREAPTTRVSPASCTRPGRPARRRGPGHAGRVHQPARTADLVSPLRLRGMAAMLARIKRQIRDQRG